MNKLGFEETGAAPLAVIDRGHLDIGSLCFSMLLTTESIGTAGMIYLDA